MNESRRWTCYTSIASRSARGYFYIINLNIIVNIFRRRVFFVKCLVVSVLCGDNLRDIKMQLLLLGVMDIW